LRGKETYDDKPATASLQPVDFDKLTKDLHNKYGSVVRDLDVLSASLYPKETGEYLEFRNKYGPVDFLDTRVFLVGPEIGEDIKVEIEKGKTLVIRPVAISELNKKTGEREVFFEMNGQLRTVFVKDKAAQGTVKANPKAVKGVPGHVGAPMLGDVLAVKVKVGQQVKKKDPLVVVSAMKMEMVVASPIDGKVKAVHVAPNQKVAGDDLLVEIE
jgi:pyruvate carboxylase